MNVLVTGGAGYIGCHTSIALLQAGHQVIVIDNLCNSRIENIQAVQKITGKGVIFYQIDVTDSCSVNKIFADHHIDAVMHFAGLKSVGESIKQPARYYRTNVIGTLVLIEACEKYGVNRLVFSSSATVYGCNQVPFVESMSLLPPTNPYGETKAMSEQILRSIVQSSPELCVAILRYFNPAGAHESGLIGEIPRGVPNNLMPFITQVAKRKLGKLTIFGNDYSTIDGTGVRDYIHVVDLAEGHLAALHHMKRGSHVFNLGTGRGTSVLQLVRAFEEANNIEVPIEFAQRRSGDIPLCYADVAKAQSELMWMAKRDILSMCRDAWNFEKNNHI
ncbi:UDP-glucose 4-epimerase GalE [Paenibacillus sp. CAU 1782]